MSSIQQQQTSQQSNISRTSGVSQQQQPVVLVSGESKDSVTVQSQLATSTVQGANIISKSNIGQVVNDLGAVHSAQSGWVDAESAKISQWGQGEIQRILSNTKAMEEQLIAQAKAKQLAMDTTHKEELAKLVQKLDLQKAAQLKELEDGLQRQIQAALTTSKQEINRIETEMNNKKMELLKQSQLRSAKEVDALSNLVVETKLTPSTTRTVIETNTSTGSVIAVATGGQISTGSAAAESYSSQQIAAVPNAGRLVQETDVRTGDMVQRSTGQKVGEGAIVQTLTEVTEQSNTTSRTGPSTLGGGATQQQHAQTLPATSQVTRPIQSSGVQESGVHHGATQRPGQAMPEDAGRKAGSTAGPVFHHDGEKQQYSGSDRTADPAYNKHAADGQQHSGGLMDKVRHALGAEPKSTDATRRV